MSQFKKIGLLTGALLFCHIAYAGVVSITDTDYTANVKTRAMSSSTPTSTPSDEGGHTSTATVTPCGEYSADSAEGCNTLLGIEDAIATPCDGGRYTCEYPTTPTPFAELPACDTNNPQHDFVDYQGQCPDRSDADLCLDEEGNEVIFCNISCEAAQERHPTITFLSDCGETGRKTTYRCVDSVAYETLYGCTCNSDYVSAFDEKPSCTSPRIPDTSSVCTLDKKNNGDGTYSAGTKHLNKCKCPETYFSSCSDGKLLGGAVCDTGTEDVYQYCLKECISNDTATYVTVDEAKVDDSTNRCGYKGPQDVDNPELWCFKSEEDVEYQIQCDCPPNMFKTIDEYCAGKTDVPDCAMKTIGLKPCKYNENKFEEFAAQCDGYTVSDPADCTSSGVTGVVSSCYVDENTPAYSCSCPEEYKTIEELCKVAHPDDADCKTKYAGENPCPFDSTKFLGLGETCPEGYQLYQAAHGCVKDGVNGMAHACYKDGDNTQKFYYCTCPSGFVQDTNCDLGMIGVGLLCEFEPSVKKYEKCALRCPANSRYGTAFECGQYRGTTGDVCYTESSRQSEQYQCKCADNTSFIVEQCGGSVINNVVTCDATCKACVDKLVSTEPPCTAESLVVQGDGTYVENELAYKYPATSFATNCDVFRKAGHNPTAGECPYPKNEICYDGSEPKKVCYCPEDWKTLEEYCSSEESCMANSIGIGAVCKLDIQDGKALVKYASYGKKCPAGSLLFENAEACAIDGTTGSATACYEENNSSIPKYICGCPSSYGTTCTNDGEIRGGAFCALEGSDTSAYKYEKCLPKCNNTPKMPVVAQPENCPQLGSFQANTEERCFNNYGDAVASYVCRCPKDKGFQTLAKFCENGVEQDGVTYTKEQCLERFVGSGDVCTFDGEDKYTAFSSICPKDRPYFSSADDCKTASISGEIDYYCYEKGNPTQKFAVCKCPDTWYAASGGAGKQCSTGYEVSGKTCNFDSLTQLKYELCTLRCDALETNGEGILYFESENNSPECIAKLSDGAVFGSDGKGAPCSRDNKLIYPCYCSKNHVEECSSANNEIPDPTTSACIIGGKIWYEKCINNECATEGASVTIIEDTDKAEDADVLCQKQFGPGAMGKRCGANQLECSCNPREYTETCEYPYKAPDLATTSWCKYSTDGNTMGNGKPHFQLGACSIEPQLAKCGKYILNSKGEEVSAGYVINVANTEGACKGQYGTGVRAQLCEYAENPNKRGYNCYFEEKDFPFTEATCPVRKVLSDEYVLKNGVRYYATCDCHTAYKFHRLNCAGMLMGASCTQKVGRVQGRDSTLINENSEVEMEFFPYCQCTSDYNQVCDGERNVGVGEPCNGKYRACECRPDPVPENWTDNYYGCPGGKKPTGVTKPNGCGGKYYQCSVTECTWQHTETCPEPLVGHDACQDNEGNIGGYKRCSCPQGYVKCAEGYVGEGKPCMLKGEYYYLESNCVEEDKCMRGEQKTCTSPLQIGVNPCKRNGITYFEYCTCANGYNKKCDGDDEVGVGDYCELDGIKLYAECATPAKTCSFEHKLACDTNQTSYDPCVNEDNQVLYKCKCPSNYRSCIETGAVEGADKCTDSLGTVYSACAVAETCTKYQEDTYTTCREFQIGAGGSCVDANGVTKYAECRATSACNENGYIYSCLGYQDDIQGDACIDDNGNRLYKECVCPSNYVSCPNSNNIRGDSCIPLYSNGTKGDIVYSFCSCDENIYKYTCETEEDSGNLGIIKGKDRECTYINEDGDTVTKYESCSCLKSYKYICTGNGQVGDEGDYCQTAPEAQKFYQSCSCEPEFNQTCDNIGSPGTSAPSSPEAVCYPINTGDSQPLYTSCECGEQYTLICDKNGQVPSDSNFCIDDETQITRYSACDCEEPYRFTCEKTGANKGVAIPTDARAACTREFYKNNTLSHENLYTYCTCSSEYKYTCTDEGLTSSLYTNIQNPQDYCEVLEGEEMVRRFKACLCPSNYVACEEGEPTGEPCLEVTSSGVVSKYVSCNCKPQVPSGYNQAGLQDTVSWSDRDIPKSSLSQGNQDEFVRKFTANCGSPRNGVVRGDGCGSLYWQCAVMEWESYPYDNTNCKPITGLKGDYKSAKGWDGDVVMYAECDTTPCNGYVDEAANKQACLTACNEAKQTGCDEKCADIGCNSFNFKEDCNGYESEEANYLACMEACDFAGLTEDECNAEGNCGGLVCESFGFGTACNGFPNPSKNNEACMIACGAAGLKPADCNEKASSNKNADGTTVSACGDIGCQKFDFSTACNGQPHQKANQDACLKACDDADLDKTTCQASCPLDCEPYDFSEGCNGYANAAENKAACMTECKDTGLTEAECDVDGICKDIACNDWNLTNVCNGYASEQDNSDECLFYCTNTVGLSSSRCVAGSDGYRNDATGTVSACGNLKCQKWDFTGTCNGHNTYTENEAQCVTECEELIGERPISCATDYCDVGCGPYDLSDLLCTIPQGYDKTGESGTPGDATKTLSYSEINADIGQRVQEVEYAIAIECNSENNATVVCNECGDYLYRCVRAPLDYKFDKAECEAKGLKLGGDCVDDSGWNGDFTMCKTCEYDPSKVIDDCSNLEVTIEGTAWYSADQQDMSCSSHTYLNTDEQEITCWRCNLPDDTGSSSSSSGGDEGDGSGSGGNNGGTPPNQAMLDTSMMAAVGCITEEECQEIYLDTLASIDDNDFAVYL